MEINTITKPSESKTEEIIAALWLIAGLLALLNGVRWLAVLLFIKSALDVFCSILVAVVEIAKQKKPNFPATEQPDEKFWDDLPKWRKK